MNISTSTDNRTERHRHSSGEHVAREGARSGLLFDALQDQMIMRSSLIIACPHGISRYPTGQVVIPGRPKTQLPFSKGRVGSRNCTPTYATNDGWPSRVRRPRPAMASTITGGRNL